MKEQDSKIFFTCHNKALANELKNRIPTFFNFMKVDKQIFTNQEIFDFIDKMAELDLEKIFSDIKNKSVVKEEVC